MPRDSLLRNAGEDTIHDHQIVPQTPQEKRKNWWYYNKVPVIIVLIAVAAVAAIVISSVVKVRPDYTVALLTSYTLPEDNRDELSRCIAEYADDRNGDGKVVIQVQNYVFSSAGVGALDTAEVQQAELVKLLADLTACNSVIFLHNEEAFDMLKDNFEGLFLYNDGTSMPEGARDYENVMYDWSEVPAFAEFVPETREGDTFTPEVLLDLFKTLRVSVRDPNLSEILNDEKQMAYVEDSFALYKRLLSGEKLPAGGEG